MRFSTFFAALALILPAFALPSPLINVVTAPSGTNGGYIVTFKSSNVRLSFTKASNCTVTHHYEIINGIAGKLTDDQIEELRAHPDVEAIYEDSIVEASALQTNATWGLARLSSRDKLGNQNARDTDFKYNYKDQAGQGVDIYIVDTGIFIEHADFGGRARWGATFGFYPNEDDNGHGTHCAGTAASTTYGVAKQANLIAVKVLGYDGIAGLNFVQISSRDSGRPSVASLSLGAPASKAMDDAVTKLTGDNIHVVVAAGNGGEDADNYSPARAQSVITVAASTIADKIAWFSNYGKAVDIFAPGQDIISTWIGSEHATNSISGTSMATPHVTGLVATFLSFGKYSPAEMQDFLKGLALQGVLSGVDSDTPNKLAQNGLAAA